MDEISTLRNGETEAIAQNLDVSCLANDLNNSYSPVKTFVMLTVLPRYVWNELIVGLLLTTALFSVVLLCVFAAQVLDDGVRLYTLFKIFPSFLPLIMQFIFPVSLLTSIILCYSRLSRDNEIMAACAAGINPLWLMTPALICAVISVFINLIVNDLAVGPALKNIEFLVKVDITESKRHMIGKYANFTLLDGKEYIAISRLNTNRNSTSPSILSITRFSKPTYKETGNWNPNYPFPVKRLIARDHTVHDPLKGGGQELAIKITVLKPVFQELHQYNIDKAIVSYGESGFCVSVSHSFGPESRRKRMKP